MLTTLDKLDINACGKIESIAACGSMRRRLLDLGFVKNTEVKCLGRSPLGDPSAYMVRGAVVAMRKRDALNVFISVLPEISGE